MGAVEEPGSVEEEWEGSLGLGVVFKEVLGEDLLNSVGLLLVETTISHGAGAAANVLDGSHGDLPHSGVGLLGAGLDSTGMGHLVLQGVRPGRAGHRH